MSSILAFKHVKINDPNIIPHHHEITHIDRKNLKNHDSKLIWFTGLSGSGKSTLASALEVQLHKLNMHTYILDGDNIRSGLNKDLDFGEESRKENIRRIAEVSNLFLDAGIIVLSAFISPFKEDRESARNLVGPENFIEVFIDTPLEVCEKRDVKGLYKKARAGQISNFTGIDSPFESPENPDIHIKTAEQDIEESVQSLLDKILPKLK